MIARPCAVPGDSLLAPRAAQPGTYADCFEVMHPEAVDLAAFLTAFYSTPLFRLERLILALVLRRPVRQAEVAALAAGAKHFAVWTVEGRDAVQILLADRAGRTLSWLAAAPKQGGATRLLFGSAVLPGQGGRLSAPVRALLPLHRLYARLLLRSAEWRLRWPRGSTPPPLRPRNPLKQEETPMSAYDDENIFAKILRGEIPSVKVYEDAETYCFMDIFPRTEGHCLVIPKSPCRNMLDATPEQLAACMATVNKVANAAKRAFKADGITLFQFNEAAGGQEVFHLHFHIHPRHAGDSIRPPGQAGDMEAIKRHAAAIAAEIPS